MRRSIAIAAIAILASVASCKDKPKPASGNPAPITKPASAGSQGSASTPAPNLPATPAKLGDPVSVEEAEQVLPKIVGTEILAPKQTSDKRQVHVTWCIDGVGADGVARQVAKWMADAGYTELSVRGDARKAGVAGDRDGFRMSMVVSASGAATCAAPAHYFASATVYRP